LEYVPAGHRVHGCPRSAYFPAAHTVQLPDMYVEKLPVAQPVHIEDPASANVPGWHGLHTVALVAPSSTEYMPGGHRVHSVSVCAAAVVEEW
jgi:hypothetical protein